MTTEPTSKWPSFFSRISCLLSRFLCLSSLIMPCILSNDFGSPIATFTFLLRSLVLACKKAMV